MGGAFQRALAAAGLVVALGAAAPAKPEHGGKSHPDKHETEQPVAPSADRDGSPASYRSPDVGYDARTRRMADCLATYPRYDPSSDRIKVRPGVSRPCPLPHR